MQQQAYQGGRYVLPSCRPRNLYMAVCELNLLGWTVALGVLCALQAKLLGMLV